MNSKIEITKGRLKHLELVEKKFRLLREAGVESWTPYKVVLYDLLLVEEKEERLEDLMSDMLSTIGENLEEPAGRGCGVGLRDDAETEIKDVIESWYETEKKIERDK